MEITFYVEVWQPTGNKCEQHASFSKFTDAVAWLDARRAEDKSRLPRLLGYTDAQQHEAMLHRGMSPE